MLNYATNPFVVNNWAQPSSGGNISALSNNVNALQTDIRNLKSMVVYDSRTVKADNLRTFSPGSAINILSPMVFTNTSLTVNNTEITGNTTTTGSLNSFSTISVAFGSFSTVAVTNDISYGGNLLHMGDARLKQNIRPLEFDSATVLAGLNPVRFNLANGREDIGLLAQDVIKVCPECVSTLPDGNLGVDYAKLVVVLLKILKDR